MSLKLISIFITDISQCGGTERTVISLANYLSENSYKVKIISLFSNKESKPFFEVDSKISVIHLQLSSYMNGSLFIKLKGYINSYLKVNRFIRDHDADIFMGTSRNTNLLCILGGKKLIIGCEHFPNNVPMNGFLRIIRNIFYKKLTKLIVLTERDQHYYKLKGISTEVIPNAIPFNSCSVDFNIKEKVALAVGRHTDQKNFKELIRIWKCIWKRCEDWTLFIVGEGPLFYENQKFAKEIGCDSIKFIKYTNSIIEYYMKASLYLMTSIYEAFPMVLIEAKNLGCVNIAYDCETGPREIIKDGNDGFLVPIDSPNDYVEKVITIMKNDDLRIKMGKTAILNSQEYTKQNIYPRWIEIIESI